MREIVRERERENTVRDAITRRASH